MASQTRTPVGTNRRPHTRPLNENRHFNSRDFRVEHEGEIKDKILEEELERLTVSHHEEVQRYEAELYSVRQLVNTLLCELKETRKEIQENNRGTHSTHLQETCERREHALECALLKQSERNKALQEELEAVKFSYHEACQLYETQIVKAQQLVDNLQWDLQESRRNITEENMFLEYLKDLHERLTHCEQSLKCDLQAEREKNTDL